MASPLANIKAIAFDAYGTLFDVYSVSASAEQLYPTRGAQIAMLWREKQIDYTRLRTISKRYVDFWQCTQDALEFVNRALALQMSSAQRQLLLDQYLRLQAFPENAAVLKALSDKGLPLAILSNGTPAMLQAACNSAGLTPYFQHLLSVDSVKQFKTADAAYALATNAFDLPAKDILFISSNAWDVAGATWFGYTTFWCNRAGAQMEVLGVQPHYEGRKLTDLIGV